MPKHVAKPPAFRPDLSFTINEREPDLSAVLPSTLKPGEYYQSTRNFRRAIDGAGVTPFRKPSSIASLYPLPAGLNMLNQDQPFGSVTTPGTRQWVDHYEEYFLSNNGEMDYFSLTLEPEDMTLLAGMTEIPQLSRILNRTAVAQQALMAEAEKQEAIFDREYEASATRTGLLRSIIQGGFRVVGFGAAGTAIADQIAGTPSEEQRREAAELAVEESILGPQMDESAETKIRERLYNEALVELQLEGIDERPRSETPLNLGHTGVTPEMDAEASRLAAERFAAERQRLVDPVGGAAQFERGILDLQEGNIPDAGMYIVQGGFAGLMHLGVGIVDLFTLPQLAEDSRFAEALTAPGLGGIAGSTYAWLDSSRSEFDAATEVSLLETEELLDEGTDEIRETVSQAGIQQAIIQMELEKPEVYAEQLQLAGSPGMMAALLLEQTEEDEEIQQQLDAIVGEIMIATENRLDELDEAEWSVSKAMLDGLSTWGRFVDGLATSALILLTDGDVHDEIGEFDFGQAFEELVQAGEDADWTPSRYLGIDGTLLGLTTDLGLGIIFDPTTWIFAPAGFGRNATTRGASRAIAESAPMIRYSDDLMTTASAMDQTAAHFSYYLDPYSAMGLDQIILERAGFQPSITGRGAWRDSTRGAMAGYVNTDEVMRLLPDDVLERSVGDAPGHSNYDNFTKNGMDEPIELLYSEADDAFMLVDGKGRVGAAVAAEHTQVPIVIRHVDEFDSARTILHPDTPPAIRAELMRESDIAIRRLMDERSATFGMGEETTGMAAQILDGWVPHAGSSLVIWKEFTYTRQLLHELRTAAKTPDSPFVYRGITAEEARGIVDSPSAAIDYPMNSFTEDITVARAFAGEDGWTINIDLARGDDFQGLSVQDYTVPTGKRVAQREWVANGQFAVLEVDELNKVIKVTRVGDSPGLFPHRGMNAEEFLGPDRTVAASKRRPVQDPSVPGEWMHPRDVFPPEMRRTASRLTAEDMVEINTKAIASGADLTAANQTILARQISDQVQDMAKDGTISPWLRRQFDGIDNMPYIPMQGAAVQAHMYRLVHYLEGGRNPAFLNKWLDEFYELSNRQWSHQQAIVQHRLDADALREGLDAIRDASGTPPYQLVDYAKRLGVEDLPIQEQVRLVGAEIEKSIDAHMTKSLEMRASAQWEDEFVDAVRRFEDDYFDTFLREKFAGVGITKIDDMFNSIEGLPMRETLPVGRTQARTAKELAEQQGLDSFDLNKLQRLLGEDRPMGMFTRMSPLEMLTASEATGAMWLKIQQQSFANMARRYSWTMMNFWVMDKIMRPSTFMVMSADEILFQFHRHGSRSVASYTRSRALNMEARIRALTHGEGFSVAAGSAYLSPRKLARLQRLQRGVESMKHLDETLFQQLGTKLDEIDPSAIEYLPHQRVATGQWLNQPGFQAYLAGPAKFQEWWNSADALPVRQKMKIQQGGQGRLFNDWEEAWQYYDNVMEFGYRRQATIPKGKTQADWDQAWRDAAEGTVAAGRIQYLPDWVIRDMGPVSGVRRVPENAGPARKAISQIGEVGISGPAAFRQGWIGEQNRVTKMAQLEKLAADQNIPILGYDKIEAQLGVRPGSLSLTDEGRRVIDKIAFDQGIWTEGYIWRLAEDAGEKSVREQTYMWTNVSRAGHSARPFAPFVRAWAEMWRRWGREAMSRPQLRGYLNNRNFMGLGKIANDAVDLLPANPRTGAFISRLANTDFQIDRGYGIGGDLEGLIPGTGQSEERQGLIPGTESTDLSPLFFLPVGGDQNPFSVMIPGLGPVPMLLMDQVITTLYDPLEQPEEYQNLVGQLAEFFPYVEFQQGGLTNRLAGGGNIGNLGTLMGDLIGAAATINPIEATSIVGDVNREVMLNRELSVQWADPEFIEDLESATTVEEIELLLQSGVHDASVRASLAHSGRTVTRMFLPINADFHDAPAELEEVWLSVADQVTFLQPRDYRPNSSYSPEDQRQTANAIRRQFFALPPDTRTLLVAEHSELAGNLVPSWVWTEAAVNRGLADNVLIPYRSDGSRTALALHDNYVRQGLLQPMDANLRGRLIAGTFKTARFQSIQRAYTVQADTINDLRWEVFVKPETKAKLEGLIEDYPELGIRDARQLWEKYGSLGGYIVDDIISDMDGVEPDSDFAKFVASIFNVPDKQAAWGTTWRGDDYLEFSARFRDFPMELGPDVIEISRALGLDLHDGMLGDEFLIQLVDAKNDEEDLLWQTIRPEYRSWKNSRVGGAEVDGMLRDLGQKTTLPDEFRGAVEEFRVFVDLQTDMAFQEDGNVPRSVQDDVVDRFNKLAHISPNELDWDRAWELGFARTYGPREWEEPVVPTPLRDDGELAQGAFIPFIQQVRDGDSLAVSTDDSVRVPLYGDIDGTVPRHFQVRLLGVEAPEYAFTPTEASAARQRLVNALSAGVARGDTIYLVRDSDFARTDVDPFGRALAWLWIGDELYADLENMQRGS